MISRTCVEAEGNEFESEGMSPRLQVYVRDTFVHKDEETLKTYSENPITEIARTINVDMISRTCLEREDNEFENEEMSPIRQVDVRESLMK